MKKTIDIDVKALKEKIEAKIEILGDEKAYRTISVTDLYKIAWILEEVEKQEAEKERGNLSDTEDYAEIARKRCPNVFVL